MKSCFFIGNHDAPSEIFDELSAEIERHIACYEVREFYVGHYGRFDDMVQKALVQAKEKYPNIKLYLLLPYHPAERKVELPDGFDESYYPFDKPAMKRYAIVKANQFMIDKCDYLISYCRFIGKTRDFIEYAMKKKKIVTLIKD